MGKNGTCAKNAQISSRKCAQNGTIPIEISKRRHKKQRVNAVFYLFKDRNKRKCLYFHLLRQMGCVLCGFGMKVAI